MGLNPFRSACFCVLFAQTFVTEVFANGHFIEGPEVPALLAEEEAIFKGCGEKVTGVITEERLLA